MFAPGTRAHSHTTVYTTITSYHSSYAQMGLMPFQCSKVRFHHYREQTRRVEHYAISPTEHHSPWGNTLSVQKGRVRPGAIDIENLATTPWLKGVRRDSGVKKPGGLGGVRTCQRNPGGQCVFQPINLLHACEISKSTMA